LPVLIIGGNALEIIAWDDVDRNRLVVFHAMKLRKRYYFLLRGNANEL
jgi:hypothetical protein